jgi:hypothetical protein
MRSSTQALRSPALVSTCRGTGAAVPDAAHSLAHAEHRAAHDVDFPKHVRAHGAAADAKFANLFLGVREMGSVTPRAHAERRRASTSVAAAVTVCGEDGHPCTHPRPCARLGSWHGVYVARAPVLLLY